MCGTCAVICWNWKERGIDAQNKACMAQDRSMDGPPGPTFRADRDRQFPKVCASEVSTDADQSSIIVQAHTIYGSAKQSYYGMRCSTRIRVKF